MLPPRQRAALILRDVLGFRAREAAALLETTEESVTSALKRALAALAAAGRREPPPPAGSAAERALLAKLSRAYETHDIDGLVALLADDVLCRPVALITGDPPNAPALGGQRLLQAGGRRSHRASGGANAAALDQETVMIGSGTPTPPVLRAAAPECLGGCVPQTQSRMIRARSGQ